MRGGERKRTEENRKQILRTTMQGPILRLKKIPKRPLRREGRATVPFKKKGSRGGVQECTLLPPAEEKRNIAEEE